MREINYQVWLHHEKMVVSVIKIHTTEKLIRYYDTSHCKKVLKQNHMN